jgi:rod shape-determining protein MreC
MRDAIELLLKFGYHLLFIALQFICFYLIINYNQNQKLIFINSTNILASKVNAETDEFKRFSNLRVENTMLQQQNAKLIRRFIDYDVNSSIYQDDTLSIDSSSKYIIQATQICNSTFTARNNFVTLCQGSKDGIKVDDGVITQTGLVGVVKRVSENRAVVMSLLHSQTNISCSILSNVRSGINSSGILVWKGSNPKICNLEAIPKHLKVIQGDTIITSGYSTIFPKGIMVGKVKNVSLAQGSNSYTIDVELFNDPSAWDAIYIVRNKLGEEQKALESEEVENE